MGLNIQNERVHALARQAAAATGRTQTGAIELALAADQRKGRRPRNFGNGEYGATWDEWGAIFAALFDADPDATCYAYDGREDFHYKTGDRFLHGLPDEPHDQHGDQPRGYLCRDLDLHKKSRQEEYPPPGPCVRHCRWRPVRLRQGRALRVRTA